MKARPMCLICVSGGELFRGNRGMNTAVSSPDGCWCSVNNDTAVSNARLALNSICNDGSVDDVVTVATGLIAGHPAVKSVTFAGSRSRGTHEQLSDWDFAVETFDFDALAHDLPALVAPLEPLGQQWEPMGHFPVYQVFLCGPTKIEYLFLDRSQDPLPPLEPNRDTLPAINTHFWDWIWWLTTKAAIGRTDLLAEHLPRLHAHLLEPMGIGAVPVTIESAIEAFVVRRNALEQQFGVSVDRALESEVRQGIARVLDPR